MAQLALEDESELQKQFTKYMNSERDSLKIVTIGHRSVGKSSLINSLLGLPEEEDHGRMRRNTPVACASFLYFKAKITLEGRDKPIDITMWDTANIERNPAQVFEKCIDVHADVILYCINMRNRLGSDVMLGFQQLISHRFGSEILKNMVFALTFGNEVRPVRGSKEDECTYFSKQLESWQHIILDFLKEQGVAEYIVSAVPIIPAGYREDNPPDRTNWVDSFWRAVFIQKFLTRDDAKRALIGIIHRIQPKRPQPESISEENFHQGLNFSELVGNGSLVPRFPDFFFDCVFRTVSDEKLGEVWGRGYREMELSKLAMRKAKVAPRHLTTQYKVIPTVEAKWEELAISLEFEYPTLQSIRTNNVQNVKAACTDVLGKWLAGEGERGPRTWATLLEALKEIGNPELAEEIRCELCPTK